MWCQRGMSLGFASVGLFEFLPAPGPGQARLAQMEVSHGPLPRQLCCSVPGPHLSAPRWGCGAADESWLSTWGEGDGGVGMMGKAVTSPQEVLHFVGRKNVGVFS